MQTRKRGFSHERFGAAFAGVKKSLPQLGAYAYSGLVIVASVSALWFGFALSSANSFAEIRPALTASLGSLAAFFGGEVPGALKEDITAPGQIAALGELDVKSPVGGRLLSISKQGTIVAEGDVLARLDDSAARVALRSAESALAAAERDLADAQKSKATPPPPDTSGSTRDAVFVALTDAHVNLAWIMPSLEDVLYGNSIKETRGNAYAYADLIALQYPEINQRRDVLLEDFQNTNNRYTALLVKYRSLNRDASETEVNAVLNETYEVLKAAADSLKTTADFLAVVEEQFEEQEQSPLEILSSHQGAIADAQRTTNDSIEQVAFAIDASRAAPIAPESVDIASYESAVADALFAVAEAKAQIEKYVVRAPIAGTIARNDLLANATVVEGEILATIMTEETIARISLSESAVGYVQTGESARITFDAIPDLEVQGEVLAVDTAATVLDNTVTFYAIIGITPNDRVQPGMTVTAHFK